MSRGCQEWAVALGLALVACGDGAKDRPAASDTGDASSSGGNSGAGATGGIGAAEGGAGGTQSVGADGGGGAAGSAATEPIESWWLAFISDADTVGTPELYAVRAGQIVEPRVKLSAPVREGGVQVFRWSPDGKKIVYWAGQRALLDPAPWTFYLVDLSAPSPAPARSLIDNALTTGGTNFSWSPKSDALAVWVDSDADGETELSLLRLAEASTEMIPFHPDAPRPGAHPQEVAWSPDASTIAYLGDFRTFNQIELFYAGVTGAIPQDLQPVHGVLPATADVSKWSFAPTANRIAYLADADTDEQQELYLVDFVGGNATAPKKLNGTLATRANVETVVWAPDSRSLVFRADADGNVSRSLFWVDLSGAQPVAARQVNIDPAETSAGVMAAMFSPDSQKLFYTVSEGTAAPGAGTIRLFVTDLSSGTPAASVEIVVPATNTQVSLRQSPFSFDMRWFGFFNVESLAARLMVADLRATPPLVHRIPAGTPGGNLREFAFAPSTPELVYGGNQDTTGSHLYHVDLSGDAPGAPVRVNHELPEGGGIDTSAWRSDGRMLAFAETVLSQSKSELFVVPIASLVPGPPDHVSGVINAFGSWAWQPVTATP
jgi:Tol biopolymer transport system component